MPGRPLIDVLDAEVIDLAAGGEEDYVERAATFGRRQFGDEGAEGGDPATIDGAMQVILPEDGHPPLGCRPHTNVDRAPCGDRGYQLAHGSPSTYTLSPGELSKP